MNKQRNAIRIEGDIAYMTVRGNGEVFETMIDAADVGKVSAHPQAWFFDKKPSRSTAYVCSVRKKAGRKFRSTLSRLIMDAPDGMVVDHINHNTLDNRRCNLQLVTPAVNGRYKNPPRPKRERGVQFKREGVYAVALYLGSFTSEEEATRVSLEAQELLRHLMSNNRS